MTRLESKLAVITGGMSGIGRATAELFAEEGAIAIIGDIASEVDGSHADFRVEALDVAAEGDWHRVLEAVEAEYGRIDVLVNNAGLVGSYEPIETIETSDWHRIVAVNQTGTFLGMRAVVPVMRQNGGGSIVG